jgi:hypothetical protein
LLKTLSAVLMGAAVPVMHYTEMAAASLTASSMTRGELSHAASITDVGRESVILVTFLVLGTTLLTVLLDCGKEEASSLDYSKEMTHPMTTRRPTQELPSCLAELSRRVRKRVTLVPVFAEGLPLSVGEIGDELIKKLRGAGRASAGTGYAAQLAGSKTPGADFAGGRQRGQPDVAVRLLDKRGYLVSVAVNGREAVETVQRDEFAVISS